MTKKYFITTISVKPNKKWYEDVQSTCVGYLNTYKEAEKIVLNNDYDICEYCYNYAVIEAIPCGVYQFDTNPQWFKFNLETEKYEKCEPPEFSKGTCGWAMN